MQRIKTGLWFLMFCGLIASSSAQTTSTHNVPNLKEYTSSKRTFTPIGCRGIDLPCFEHVPPITNQRVVQANYDMTASIARGDTFDIVHYDMDLDLTEYNLQQMTAHAGINLTVLQNGASNVSFDLVELNVDSVFMDGVAVDFSHEEELLVVPAAEGAFFEGDSHVIDVYYHGHPGSDPYWGGVYFASNYIYHMGIGLTSIPPNYGRVWHPCFDNFVERATYTWNVKSAGGRKAHLQGTFLGETFEDGDTLSRSFTLQHPITTHQAAFAVSNYVDSNYIHVGAYGDVPVRLTAKPEDISQMVNKFANLGYAIDALEYWWGPYAWERVGYILTTQGALEIPTNTAYPRSMIEESLYANSDLLSHELGHQWWGNIVAPFIHNHMWIKEGAAEYSSHLYIEWKDGHEDFVSLVKDNQQFVLEECHVQDEGFHPMSPMPDDHIYGRHTYYKGASIHHNLRAYLGDDLYREACQAAISTNFDSHMDPEGFIEVLEQFTGVDLDPYFDAQIFQPGFSTWLIDSTTTIGNSTSGFETHLYLNQKLRACSSFHENEPLDVSLWGAEWGTTIHPIRVGGEWDEATIYHEEPFVLIALNADGKLNQGRLDHTVAITETTGLSSLPWVELRLGCDEITDSVLVRVEHHWAAPDAEPLAFYFDEISASHFWTIDGTWEDGIEGTDDLVLDARFSYVGSNNEGLDYDLYNGGELGAFLAWRPSSDATWEQYPDYTWQAGSLENGNGVFKVSVLRKGQYAFALGDVLLNISDAELTDEISGMLTYPSPTDSELNIVNPSTEGKCTVNIYDINGRLVMAKTLFSESAAIDVSSWKAGVYSAVFSTNEAEVIVSRFTVK